MFTSLATRFSTTEGRAVTPAERVRRRVVMGRRNCILLVDLLLGWLGIDLWLCRDGKEWMVVSVVVLCCGG